MLQARDYSVTETLRDGRMIEFRALKPEDRADMLAAIGRISEQSLYRRFFSFKHGFTEREVDFYVDVDFVSHVALVAVLEEDGRPVIVGGARYIVVQPGQADREQCHRDYRIELEATPQPAESSLRTPQER